MYPLFSKLDTKEFAQTSLFLSWQLTLDYITRQLTSILKLPLSQTTFSFAPVFKTMGVPQIFQNFCQHS